MNNKMDHPLITEDGRTLMNCPLEPPNFVVDTLQMVRSIHDATYANDYRDLSVLKRKRW